MQFDSWQEFFAMGGHALYVWLAYGATLLMLIGNYLTVRATRRSVVQRVRLSASEVFDSQRSDDENKL